MKMFPFIILTLVHVVLSTGPSDNDVCPGGGYSCPDYATCCQLADLSYGCCPMKNAVCCDDHIHCCPPNTKCTGGTCIQLDNFNVTSKKVIIKSKEIHCSDTEYVCPDGSTCCKVPDVGAYACCPLEHAVCCVDGQHCCPEGSTCNLESKTCTGRDYVSYMYNFNKTTNHKPLYINFSVLKKSKNVSNTVCPESEFQCPDGYTCCKLPDGTWGCCPFAKATCCSDHQHCCPEDMQCGPFSQTCSRKGQSVMSALKIPAEPISVNKFCPDKTSCFHFETCCKMETHFGCCIHPNAVCCSDGAHCCPYGTICDIERKQCIHQTKTLNYYDSINMI